MLVDAVTGTYLCILRIRQPLLQAAVGRIPPIAGLCACQLVLGSLHRQLSPAGAQSTGGTININHPSQCSHRHVVWCICNTWRCMAQSSGSVTHAVTTQTQPSSTSASAAASWSQAACSASSDSFLLFQLLVSLTSLRGSSNAGGSHTSPHASPAGGRLTVKLARGCRNSGQP